MFIGFVQIVAGCAVAGCGFYFWNKNFGGIGGGSSSQYAELPPTVLTSRGISSSYGGPNQAATERFIETIRSMDNSNRSWMSEGM